MRIPSLTHRSRPADDEQSTTEGTVPVGRAAVSSVSASRADHRPPNRRPETGPARGRTGEAPTGATATIRRAGTDASTRDTSTRDTARRREPDRAGRTEPDTPARPDATPAGPRPRASRLATLGLILAVAAVLCSASGALAVPGLVLGAIALLFGIGGISATSQRHVAGRLDALLAVVLAVGAMVLGVLAITDALPWLSSNSNEVADVRGWLDRQLPWLDRL